MVDARDYHAQTDHILQELRDRDFSLDFENQPTPYKSYLDRPSVDPETPLEVPDTPALEAITTADSDGDGEAHPIDIPLLCRYAAGVTKDLERDGESIRFRAASCTGKLYHVDLYAVCGDVPGFDPGVYHYDPDADSFDVLREGDYRGVLAAATGGYEPVADAPVTFVATSEWWRNAWKYEERTYRHAFWDSGTILANLLAVAHDSGHPAEVVTGFADGPVVDLLGLDPDDEAPLELVPVGAESPAPDPPALDPIDPETAPLSPNPIDYPLVADAWRQSTLPDRDAARTWRGRTSELDRSDVGRHGIGDGELVELDPVGPGVASSRPIANTIERRGSLREFPHETISDRMLATILDRALGPVPIECLTGTELSGLVDTYCLLHAVDGIPNGTYQYHHHAGVLEHLGDTDRQTAGHIAVGQTVVGDAAVNVYLMADVDAVVEALGNRGYRVAQLEAGILLGRLYLATYAHRRLGGRGFTFLDRQVTDHLSPRAKNQAPMTMFAFGPRPQ